MYIYIFLPHKVNLLQFKSLCITVWLLASLIPVNPLCRFSLIFQFCLNRAAAVLLEKKNHVKS